MQGDAKLKCKNKLIQRKCTRLDTIKKPDTGQFTRLIKRTKLEMSKISLRPGAKLYISGKRE
jgi:hypothetical protein